MHWRPRRLPPAIPVARLLPSSVGRLAEIDMPEPCHRFDPFHPGPLGHPAVASRRAAILALLLLRRRAPPPSAALSGRVTDGHGGAVAAANVRVRRDDGTITRRTASDVDRRLSRVAACRPATTSSKSSKPGSAPTSPSSRSSSGRGRHARRRARRRRRARHGRRHRVGRAAVDARDVEGDERHRRARRLPRATT